jgi:NAD(P)-dependent dehydrogenase (short-subunit alcohol dehydrogenase family)
MGSAIACRLAAEGANLVLADISLKRLEAAADTIRAAMPECRIVTRRCDVLNAAEIEDLLRSAGEHFSAIDVLVNVVGGIRKGGIAMPLMEMPVDRWDDAWEFNLKATFSLVRAVARDMRERRYGRIVNLSSITYGGDGRQPEYAAAKAAVASLTKSLALELAPEVTVNCIAPGLIETSVLDRMDRALIDEYLERAPLRRLGKPADVAAAAAYLASDDASFVTGAILPVSGGIWNSL